MQFITKSYCQTFGTTKLVMPSVCRWLWGQLRVETKSTNTKFHSDFNECSKSCILSNANFLNLSQTVRTKHYILLIPKFESVTEPYSLEVLLERAKLLVSRLFTRRVHLVLCIAPTQPSYKFGGQTETSLPASKDFACNIQRIFNRLRSTVKLIQRQRNERHPPCQYTLLCQKSCRIQVCENALRSVTSAICSAHVRMATPRSITTALYCFTKSF